MLYNKQQGFTLIELMVVTSIIAIFIGMAANGFSSTTANNSAAPTVKALEESITLARSEAITRGVPVQVIPIAGADWAQGWRVNVLNPNKTQNKSIPTLREHTDLPNRTIFNSTFINLGSATTQLIMEPSGRAQSIGTIDIRMPNCTGNNRYQLNVLISGMIDIDRTLCP